MGIDSVGQVVLIGGKPTHQELTIPQALEFMADMCHASQGGQDGDRKAAFYQLGEAGN